MCIRDRKWIAFFTVSNVVDIIIFLYC